MTQRLKPGLLRRAALIRSSFGMQQKRRKVKTETKADRKRNRFQASGRNEIFSSRESAFGAKMILMKKVFLLLLLSEVQLFFSPRFSRAARKIAKICSAPLVSDFIYWVCF